MTEQYAGALLYLVPVIVAAVVAFVVTRPEVTRPEKEEAPAPTLDAAPCGLRVPAQRTYGAPPSYAGSSSHAGFPSYTAGGNRRGQASTPQSPTLLHAALSSHLAAVSRTAGSANAPRSSPVVRPARLVSIRRPARIPRRPLYQCPHKRP